MNFKPSVLSVRPERELRWLGHLLVPGIFDGEHYFLLEPIGEDRTRLTQGEKFSGLLVGLLGSTLAATGAGFKAMNTALRQQVERDEGPKSRSPKRLRGRCPLWVKSRHLRRKTSCPLYLRKRTCAVQRGMSALGQKRTHAVQQKESLFDHLAGLRE